MKLMIKATHVQKVACWGITDGKLWFAYAYPKFEDAQEVVCRFTREKIKDLIKVNLAYPAPITTIELKRPLDR
jgi:GH35 family endo-1,4-beta-xylanase